MIHFAYRGLLAAAALFLTAQPAVAASKKCVMASIPFRCTTGAVSANPKGNFVHIDLSPHVAYKVYDSTNGVVVKSGTSAWTGTRKTITGLYAKYHIKAEAKDWRTPTPALASINNDG